MVVGGNCIVFAPGFAIETVVAFLESIGKETCRVLAIEVYVTEHGLRTVRAGIVDLVGIRASKQLQCITTLVFRVQWPFALRRQDSVVHILKAHIAGCTNSNYHVPLLSKLLLIFTSKSIV
ncbi:unnamed protein product, partial [Linum tenue]